MRPAVPRGRARAWLVLAIAGLGLAGLLASAAQDGLTYWGTPSELTAQGPPERDVRLGGLVVTGSVVEEAAGTSFVLTDGATDVTVRYAGVLPATVREGEGAVVEGVLDGQVLHARSVLLRHSNEYRPPEGAS
ncbi:cytochrome c maturation protein CcmE [Promicromonospora iranensis]|uniref:Cytochrome c-type biogenesis protein CcmE n=1 Tax=Promicromonospora iranensis TaxID=1105144 RepID=A0ABU2CI71_9MICO|nr:cytochrome c maturation protein CcmE [Promicromonospora iranensis]MDR7381038.1 cytochrome c-type biogenesis protein CcmE [Promicromonospora iranensis]